MRTSFLLDNRDSSRPPLLLPSLSSSYSYNNNSIDPTTTTISYDNIPSSVVNTTVTNVDLLADNVQTDDAIISNNPLDSLARLATIIPRLSVTNEDSIINQSTDFNNTATTSSSSSSSSSSLTGSITPVATTKRRKKKTKIISNVDILTPPPTKPGTPSTSIYTNNSYSINNTNSNTDVPTTTEGQLYPSKYYKKLAEQGASSKKRQRIGPSCDKCRLKKIKCNASIEIILRDSRIVGMFNEHLHYTLTDQDIEMFNKNWSHLFGVKLPYTICNIPIPKSSNKSNDSAFPSSSSSSPSPSPPSTTSDNNSKTTQEPEYQVVVKHLDKLIIFQSCTSCNKRKYKNSESGPMSCKFARGFSRPDINQFNKIKVHMTSQASSSCSFNPSTHKNMPIYDLTINDYQNAGFQLIPLH